MLTFNLLGGGIDHYDCPQNIGILDKNDPTIGVGKVVDSGCGDKTALYLKITEKECYVCEGTGRIEKEENVFEDSNSFDESSIICPRCEGRKTPETIVDARFETNGCKFIVAGFSWASEWLKGKTIAEARKLKTIAIVRALRFGPDKLHCAVLVKCAVNLALKSYLMK